MLYYMVISTDIYGVMAVGNNLVIRFRNGGEYAYINAAHELNNLLNANSKGKYFHQFIKPYYVCKKLL